MTYQQWFERELSRKLHIIDLYLTDIVKHKESLVFLWHEPVISDWEPEDYDSPFADRHFQSHILTHIKKRWSVTIVETTDGFTAHA